MYGKVGITFDVKECRRYWQEKFPKLENWQIIETGLTYEEAIIAEKKYAKDLGGVTDAPSVTAAAPRVRGPAYSIYYFD